jgi:hypothetical protein
MRPHGDRASAGACLRAGLRGTPGRAGGRGQGDPHGQGRESVLLHVEHPETIELEFAHQQPGSLVLTVTAREASVGYAGRPPLQAASLSRSAESSLRVQRAGEFIEVFLDDKLVISTRAYTDVCQGITAHVDSRPVVPCIQAVIPEGIKRDDLSAVTQRYSSPASA